MGPIEISVIVISVLIVGDVFGTYIYKKIKKIPTSDCGCSGKSCQNCNKCKK